MPLTDAVICNAMPQAKPLKMYDAGGLLLIVRPSGKKLWRLKYRFNKAEHQLSIGIYPTIGLDVARDRRDEAKKLLADGIDPGAEKKRKFGGFKSAVGQTFKSLMDEFIDLKERGGLAGATLIKQKWFASQLQPFIGHRPIGAIEALEVLNAVKDIEKQGKYETARRVRAFASRVFRYAIITGRAKVNPASELAETLVHGKVRHHAAIVDSAAVGTLMNAIKSYDGNLLTRLSLQLLAHIFVRPGELRHAEWSEIDFETAVWCIPAGKIKMRQDRVIPLSRQALDLLIDARKEGSGSKYVFPSFGTNLKPMSENTLNAALRRLGYSKDEMTAYGFRTTASTLLNESGKWSPNAIERALGHNDGNANRGIYIRGVYWHERVKLAQWWSDYLDTLCDCEQLDLFSCVPG